MAKTLVKSFFPFKLGVPPPEMAVCPQFMQIFKLAVFDLVFLKEKRSCENEIHWIMFHY